MVEFPLFCVRKLVGSTAHGGIKTGITKAVVCVILSVGLCIKRSIAANRKE